MPSKRCPTPGMSMTTVPACARPSCDPSRTSPLASHPTRQSSDSCRRCPGRRHPRRDQRRLRTLRCSSCGRCRSIRMAVMTPRARAYMARIGMGEPVARSVDGLERLQRAHLTRVPFDSLDVFAGREVRTDIGWSVPKIVDRGRGGWCYELEWSLRLAARRAGLPGQAAGRDRLADARSDGASLTWRSKSRWSAPTWSMSGSGTRSSVPCRWTIQAPTMADRAHSVSSSPGGRRRSSSTGRTVPSRSIGSVGCIRRRRFRRGVGTETERPEPEVAPEAVRDAPP